MSHSPNPYGLALHTTTPELGLAISNFTSDSRSQVWHLERELSSKMHYYLMEFIQPQTWADLGFIAVAKGPGGFTGTRIGVVTARTLGQQLQIPVFVVSTLAAFAWEQLSKNTQNASIDIAVEMRAQRGQIFAAIYQKTMDGCGLQAIIPDTVMTAEIWQAKLANWHQEYQLIQAENQLAASVNSILQLAYFDWQSGNRPDWSEALPFYGQHPV